MTVTTPSAPSGIEERTSIPASSVPYDKRGDVEFRVLYLCPRTNEPELGIFTPRRNETLQDHIEKRGLPFDPDCVEPLYGSSAK